jgi:hypothetical protein
VSAINLDEIVARLGVLPEKERKAVVAHAMQATRDMPWCPNPGPQTDAFYSEADEVFYGGQAGPGKTDLLVGLSLTAHRRSLLLRRTHKEAGKLAARYEEILGTRDGWNGQDMVWRLSDRHIDIGGCQLEDDKQKYKGDPHDLIGFDEVSDFSESQYEFIITWCRSVTPGQRCRVVAAGNPPTRPGGLWVIRRWAAWLDPRHHHPAKPGELRWYVIGDDGKEHEVDGPGPHIVGNKPTRARSRTFIRGRLEDNPDLAATNYDATLAALPAQLRDAYREGRFDASLKDDPWQVIPTAWVQAAQQRWTPRPPPGVPMCAIGVDVAQGGEDETVLAIRHDGWFAALIGVAGKLTPDGPAVAGLVVQHRRDGAVVVIDMGGGYGGAALGHLIKNNIECIPHRGMEPSTKRTQDRRMGFFNKRSEVIWRFREALDPSQPQGSPIALPDDPGLVADLTAPSFEMTPRGWKVESKEDVCKRLGRSTDRGDAVVMAWAHGEHIVNQRGGWAGYGEGEMGTVGQPGGHRRPEVVHSRQSVRKAVGR